jgi:GAF domain-containing protein
MPASRRPTKSSDVVGCQGTAEPRRASSLIVAQCPELNNLVQRDARVKAVLEQAREHCGGTEGILTWREGDELVFLKGAGLLRWRGPRAPDSQYQLFNHTISRDLPIVINDVQGHEWYGRCARPPFIQVPRFYVAAPLVYDGQLIGTLCVTDAQKPRAQYSLDEADFLVHKAAELVDMLACAMA